MKFDVTRAKNLDSENTKGYELSPVQFCFVGPSGIGKTSLLASMYNELKKQKVSNFFVDIHSELGGRTKAELDAASQEMLDMLDETEEGAVVELGKGLRGDADERLFEFTGTYTVKDDDIVTYLPGVKDFKKFQFKFRFIDMPGGWYEPTSEQRGRVKEILTGSLVSFVAVDAPALMHRGEAMCKRFNKVDTIEEWYSSEMLAQLKKEHHCVVIVLSRCEKFWDKRDDMLKKLGEVYKVLIDRLKEFEIPVFATWIKTLGGVQFSHFESTESGAKVARFKRLGGQRGEYKPENCATPLQLALSHGLACAAVETPTDIFDWLGLDVNQLAVNAANCLGKELEEKVHAGVKDTYKTL